MRILAMDLSLNCPGFALVEINKRQAKILEKSIVNNSKDHLKPKAQRKSTAQKIQETARTIHHYLTEYKPDIVMRERGFSRHALTTQQLFRVVGAADLIVYDTCGKEIEELPPTSIKKAITGSGKAEKSDVARCVERYVGFQLYETEDESDAVAAALSWAIKIGEIDFIEVPDITPPRIKVERKRKPGRPKNKKKKIKPEGRRVYYERKRYQRRTTAGTNACLGRAR